MSIDVGETYRVIDVSHGRFLNPAIKVGDECEVSGMYDMYGIKVAVLLFPKVLQWSTRENEVRECKEYAALSRKPENWLVRT